MEFSQRVWSSHEDEVRLEVHKSTCFGNWIKSKQKPIQLERNGQKTFGVLLKMRSGELRW